MHKDAHSHGDGGPSSRSSQGRPLPEGRPAPRSCSPETAVADPAPFPGYSDPRRRNGTKKKLRFILLLMAGLPIQPNFVLVCPVPFHHWVTLTLSDSQLIFPFKKSNAFAKPRSLMVGSLCWQWLVILYKNRSIHFSMD